MAAKKKLPDLPKGFYWRGSVIWISTDPVTGKPETTRCRSVAGCLAYRAQQESRACSPVHKAASQATVGIWAARICKIKNDTRAGGTSDMYAIKTGHLVRIFGAGRPLIEIDANAIDHYIGTRQGEGVKNTTIQRELTCLYQLLRHARRSGEYHLELSQVKPIGFSSNYVPRTTVMPLAELPILLALLPVERAAWVCAALATAGDISDVERILPGDYSPERQTIKMRGTKNRHRSNEIPIPTPYVELIERALPFLPLSWPRVSHDLPQFCLKHGLTRITPKDLRRTSGTWLEEKGVELTTLSKFLRHGGTKVTHDVYAQAQPEAVGRNINRQLQNHYSEPRPLGGMADAGDLKAPQADRFQPKTSENSPISPPNRHGKTRAGSTDPLHLAAEARVRRLQAAVGVDPEAYALPLQLAKAVLEAHYLGEGDDRAAANLEVMLQECVRLLEGEAA